jgi:hypothetical protein
VTIQYVGFLPFVAGGRRALRVPGGTGLSLWRLIDRDRLWIYSRTSAGSSSTSCSSLSVPVTCPGRLRPLHLFSCAGPVIIIRAVVAKVYALCRRVFWAWPSAGPDADVYCSMRCFVHRKRRVLN